MKDRAIINPFTCETYQGSDYFCDRRQEAADMPKSLQNGNNINLYGPRGMGKTCLIHHVFESLQERTDAKCLYVDISRTSCLKDFIDKMATSIVGSMDGRMEAFAQNAFRIFGTLHPSVTVGLLTGAPTLTLDIAKENEENTLRNVFGYLKEKGERCFVAIDEFQQIREYPEKGTEALLRSYIQFLPNVNFIFSGSRRHIMLDVFSNPQKPFYDSAESFKLDVIDPHEYFLFAERFFREKGAILSEDVFSQMYGLARGHTWYVQKWLNMLYYRFNGKIVEEKDCMDALRTILQRESDRFGETTLRLKASEKKIVRAIAREKAVRQPQGATFIKKYDLPAASTIKSCIGRLIDQEILYFKDGEYFVYNPFYSIWLAG